MNALHNTADNTITIKPAAPVDAATFARLRAAGFAWRTASGAFIAANSDQARALATELAGHIQTTPPEALQASGEQVDGAPLTDIEKEAGRYLLQTNPGGVSRLITQEYFFYNIDGDDVLFSDSMRRRIEHYIGAQLVEIIYPGYEGEIALTVPGDHIGLARLLFAAEPVQPSGEDFQRFAAFLPDEDDDENTPDNERMDEWGEFAFSSPAQCAEYAERLRNGEGGDWRAIQVFGQSVWRAHRHDTGQTNSYWSSTGYAIDLTDNPGQYAPDALEYLNEWGHFNFVLERDAAIYAARLERGEGGVWRAEKVGDYWRAHRAYRCPDVIYDAGSVQDSGEAETVQDSGEKPAGTYSIMHNVGHAKYVVNFHDGQKTRADGSPFFDIRIFKNKRRMNAFVIALRERGYSDSAPTAPTSGEEKNSAKSIQDSDQAPPKYAPRPPKYHFVEHCDRDGVTRTYYANRPKRGHTAWPAWYNQAGIQAQRIAKLRAAGIAASARGMAIIIDPSGEVPPAEPCATLIPGRWIPGGAENAERIACVEALGAEVWLTDSRKPGALAVIVYSGKRTKRDAFYTMPDRERAQQWAGEYIDRLQQNADRQAERNAEKKAKRATGHKLKPGDVLRSSWGYDQTNIDYYEVTKLIGKTMVEIRQIGRQSDETGWLTGECVPKPGHYIGEPMRKTVSAHDGLSVRIASYASAYKIEPREIGGVKCYETDHWTAYA